MELGITSLGQILESGALARITHADALSMIGAAASSHTHLYAGSASAGGAATSAIKLLTARAITIGGESKNFDGSAAISFSLASIGAAPAIHSHTLPALTITPNYGASTIYNGSEAKTLALKFLKVEQESANDTRKVSENIILKQDYFSFNQNFYEGVLFAEAENENNTTGEANQVFIKTNIPHNASGSYVIFCKGYSLTDPKKIIDVRLSFKVNGSLIVPDSTSIITNGSIIVTSGKIGFYTWSSYSCVVFSLYFATCYSPNFRIDVLAQNSNETYYNGWFSSYAKAGDGDIFTCDVNCNPIQIIPSTGIVTLSSLGAAPAVHTHLYAGSASAGGAATSAITALACTGNAATATTATSAIKLLTARAITIGGESKNFDGSAAISFSLASIGAAPISHAFSGNTYGVANGSNYGHAKASLSTPLANSGTGAFGTANGIFANADHVHPLQENIAGVASLAARLQYPRRFALTGGATAEAKSFDGSDDLFLCVTRLDPYSLDVPVPLEKGGTGATSAAGALSAIGAAPASHTHTAVTLTSLGVTASAAEINICDGLTATTSELNYCVGVTSSIQNQLAGKSDSSHTHTPASIGAAASSHSHSYLPLSGGNVTGNINLSYGKVLNITGASGVPRFVSGDMVIGTLPLSLVDSFRRPTSKTLREDDGDISTSDLSPTQLSNSHHTPGTDSIIHLVIGQTSGMSEDFYRYINLPALGTGALEGDRIEMIVTNRNASHKGRIHFNPSGSGTFRTIDGSFVMQGARIFGSGERCTFYAIKETTSGALEWRVVKTAESKF